MYELYLKNILFIEFRLLHVIQNIFFHNFPHWFNHHCSLPHLPLPSQCLFWMLSWQAPQNPLLHHLSPYHPHHLCLHSPFLPFFSSLEKQVSSYQSPPPPPQSYFQSQWAHPLLPCLQSYEEPFHGCNLPPPHS